MLITKMGCASSLTELQNKLPRKHFVLDLKKRWFSTNASSNFKYPFPSAFGKVLAFLAQPSSDGEKYALLSAGTVSVNHQQVVIQPTSKHIKCIYDTESFHLIDYLCSTVGEGRVNTKKDIYRQKRWEMWLDRLSTLIR